MFLETSKYDAKKNLRRVDGATLLHAALFGQVRDQAIHHSIVGPANERRCLPLLRNEPDQDQLLQMVGKRRRGGAQTRLKLADRDPPLTDFYKGAVNGKARRVAKRLKPGGYVIEFHGANIQYPSVSSTHISRILEIHLDSLTAVVIEPDSREKSWELKKGTQRNPISV